MQSLHSTYCAVPVAHRRPVFPLRLAPLLLVLLAAPSSHFLGVAETAAPALPILQRLQQPAVGAHRGGSWATDNNTLSRFRSALADGVDVIEFDLQLTADGVPVVHHDPTLARLFGQGPEVSSITLEQLRQHRVALCHPIPTFEEVLQWCQGRAVLNAEFKTQEVVVPAVDLVGKYQAHEWVYFQTKSDPERYRLARQRDPKVALLFKPGDDQELDWALGLHDPRLVVIEIGENMLRPEVLDRVHRAGKVTSYNAWRKAALQEFFHANGPEIWNLGIDIVITKRPESAVRQRDAWKKTPPSAP